MSVTESDAFFNGVTNQWTLRFVWPEKPFTANWALNHHHTQVSREIGAWREAFRLMGQGCPRLARCNIEVAHETATRRNVDVAACAPTVKAAIDGLVRAGVLEDDDAQHVLSVRFNAPVYTGRDALLVTLVGEELAAPYLTGTEG